MQPVEASPLTLEAKVAFLRQPESYPESTLRVEAIETHMSWVFLTDTHAYKLKKPVQFNHLDFLALSSRQHYCAEEVRLNRRLTDGVYLGVIALTRDATGHLQLGGDEDGEPIDWLVRMRRLPGYQMLDHAIRQGIASTFDINRVAARLSGFYGACAPLDIEPHVYRERFMLDISRQQEELSHPGYHLSVAQIAAIAEAQRAVLIGQAAMFDARVEEGRIVEGHGDLRPEHVCLDAPVNIIDCLEFSPALRIVDAADEVAFLAMECARLGGADLGEQLLRSYSELSNDHPPLTLIHFYQSCRASLRALIAIHHLREEKFRPSRQWRRRTEEYLLLAQVHVGACG